MKTPEAREKDAVTRYLRSTNAYFFKPHMTGYGRAGVADIVCCFHGSFWSIEVKAPGGKPTRRQLLNAKQVEDAGGMAVIGTADEIIAAIEKWRWPKPGEFVPRNAVPFTLE